MEPDPKAMAAMKGRRDAVMKERQQKERDFYGALYPTAFHVDYDWATRGAKVPPAYGCWVEVQDGEAGWAKRNYLTQAACASVEQRAASYGQSATGTWKIRTPEGPFIYTYSQKSDPPTAPPELMRRMEDSGVKTPVRFSCRVADVVTDQSYKSINCPSSGSPSTIRVSGAIPALNVGDLVSVPLAGTKRDPDGVLFKSFGAKSGSWTVDADGATLTVDSAMACPSVAEMLGTTVDAGTSPTQQ
jgi:hypothetical protein